MSSTVRPAPEPFVLSRLRPEAPATLAPDGSFALHGNFSHFSECNQEPALLQALATVVNVGPTVALVLALLSERACMAVLLNPWDDTIWRAFDHWSVEGQVSYVLKFPSSTRQGQAPLHVDGWVSGIRAQVAHCQEARPVAHAWVDTTSQLVVSARPGAPSWLVSASDIDNALQRLLDKQNVSWCVLDTAKTASGSSVDVVLTA